MTTDEKVERLAKALLAMVETLEGHGTGTPIVSDPYVVGSPKRTDLTAVRDELTAIIQDR
jgi:hypothetical protein